MHNLITLTNYQTRLALHADAARNKAAGLSIGTVSQEARAHSTSGRPRSWCATCCSPTKRRSTSRSAARRRSPRSSPRAVRATRKGRSLRDFDLQTRLFRYPCSYLIYSEAFDALPEPAKTYVYRRLFEVLSGRDQSPEFARLTASDRRAVLEILVATKPDCRRNGAPIHARDSLQRPLRRGVIHESSISERIEPLSRPPWRC